jgi:hypothetical protein
VCGNAHRPRAGCYSVAAQYLTLGDDFKMQTTGDWMMTARKELEQKAHQLTELINATYDALASKELNDSRRESLRNRSICGSSHGNRS